MLSANETLALVLDELGHPRVVFLDAHDPTALKRAARDADDGSLLALSAHTPGQAAHLRVLLHRHVLEVRVMDVDGGFLVLGLRPRRHRAASPASPAPLPAARSAPDATPVPGAHPDDLGDRAIHRWLHRAMASERVVVPDIGSAEDRYLGSLGIYALDDGTWRPSVAAMVLAGRRPELFLPGCALVGEIDGEAVELRGVISDILRGLKRRLAAEIARPVWEVVRNALLHRDWSSEAPVEIHLEKDRLEVTNPGRVGGKPPNPLLLHLARELGVVRGKGKGLRDVAAWLKRQGLRRYSLVDRGGVVRFVADLPPCWASRRAGTIGGDDVPQATAEPASERAGESDPPALAVPGTWWPPISWPTPLVVAPPAPVALPSPEPPATTPAPSPQETAPAIPSLLPRDPDRRADAILSVLRARGRATTREIAAALGCSRPVIGKVLTALVADERVTKVSASPRSPFQAYELP